LTGDRVLIERTVPITQVYSFRTQGPFSPKAHEYAFDRGTFVDQQLARRITELETVGSAGSVVAGNGLSFTGATLNVGAGAGITLGVDDVAVSFGAAGAIASVTRAAAAAGVASAAARSDHKHDVTTAVPVDVTDSTNSEGSASTLTRSDHLHSHGNRGGGTLHASAVTSGATGFMTGTDALFVRSVFYTRYLLEEIKTGTSIGAVVGATFTLGDDNPYNANAYFSSTCALHCVATGRASDGTAYSLSAVYSVKIDASGNQTQLGETTALWEHGGTVAANLLLTLDPTFTAGDYLGTVKTIGVAAKTIKWSLTVRRHIQYDY